MKQIRVEDHWLKGLYPGKRIVEFDDALPAGQGEKVLRYDYQYPDQDIHEIAARIEAWMRTAEEAS